MKKIVLALFMLATTCYAQLQNTNISNTVLAEGEPYLAVNPANHKNIVIAWMGVTYTAGVRVSIKTKASFDGGQTWGSYHVKPHMSSTWSSADVSMAFRNDGKLFLSYIDYNAAVDSGGVYVISSADGGISWDTPVRVIDEHEDSQKKPLDRPWLVIDNSNTSNKGMMYITSKPAPWIPAPCRPYMKTSSDSGQTWSALRFVDTTNHLVGNFIQAPMAANAVTADGAFCAVYPSYVYTQSPYTQFYLAKSYNRAASFQYTTVVSNPTAVSDTNLKAGYCLRANPANAQQLAAAFIDNRNGDPDVFVTRTNDGGQTWGTPTRVNKDALGNGKAQDMVWCDYNDSGDLLVTWRDRRSGSGSGFYQQPFEAYAAVSHNNGATFVNNIDLSTVLAPFDSALANKGNDFMCCKLLSDTVCATWSDYRTGKMNVFFARTVDTTATTGIVEVNPEEKDLLEIFPNPATEKVTITLASGNYRNCKLEVFDAAGKKVYEKSRPGFSEVIISNNLPAGVYYARVFVDEFAFTKKFIINK